MLRKWGIQCFVRLKIHHRSTDRAAINGIFSCILEVDNCWPLELIELQRLGQVKGTRDMSCCGYSICVCYWHTTSHDSRHLCDAGAIFLPLAVPWHNLNAILSSPAWTQIASPKLNLWTPRGYGQARDHWAFKDQEEASKDGWFAFRPVISLSHTLPQCEHLNMLAEL